MSDQQHNNRRHNRQPEIEKHHDSIPGSYTYAYPHPAVAADCIIFGFDGTSLKLLLIERGNEPFLGYWALPGGFLHQDETIDECAARELREETNLTNVYLEQFKVYSNPKRDPRERVMSVAFIALVRPGDFNVIPGDDAAKAAWFDADYLPPLAFDHKQIIGEARERLKEILRLKPIAFNLLNEYFSLGELQRVYEVINDTTYDRRNFTRSVQDAGIVEATDVKPRKARNRPPRLYRASQRIVMEEEIVVKDGDVSGSLIGDKLGEMIVSLFNSTDELESSMPEEENKTPQKESPTKGLFDFLNRFLK